MALLALALAAMIAPRAVASEQAGPATLSYQLWIAGMTRNSVGEIMFQPHSIRPQRSGLVGLALHRRFGRVIDTRLGPIDLEAEAQLVRHFGAQTHWELNLPVALRLTPERRLLGLIDSLAYGIGPSWASQPPPLEFRPGNGHQRLQVYFHIEAARNLTGDGEAQMFLRVHHRSGVWGLVAPQGSSDAIAVGLRRRF